MTSGQGGNHNVRIGRDGKIYMDGESSNPAESRSASSPGSSSNGWSAGTVILIGILLFCVVRVWGGDGSKSDTNVSASHYQETSGESADNDPPTTMSASQETSGESADNDPPTTMSASVPYVVGLLPDDAISELESCGFSVARGADFSDAIEPGYVAYQDPEGGTWISEGDMVTIYVSKGPKRDTSSYQTLVIPPSQTRSNEYILPGATIHEYTEDELSVLSVWELYVARNEIPARHGLIFKNDDLRSYFSGKSWYDPRYTYEEFTSIEGILNATEEANIDNILAIERSMGSPYAP